MKVRLIAIIVALLVVSGLLMETRSLANLQSQQARQTFTVSKQGTLLELDTDNTSRAKRVDGDGFKLNYKTRGKMKSASAKGVEIKGLRTLTEPAKLEGNTATATVQTPDKALEIKSTFTFDANAGELTIKRKFRNISKRSVTLHMVRNYLDSTLIPGGQLYKSGRHVLESFRITAGLSVLPSDCDEYECPIPPPPPTCPPSCVPLPGPNPLPFYSRAQFYSSTKLFTLSWSKPITLKPEQGLQLAGEAFIIIRIVIR